MVKAELAVDLAADLPATERRIRREMRNSRLLQLLVVELERENAALRKENKTLRARADVLLDIMVSFLSPLVILILESNS